MAIAYLIFMFLPWYGIDTGFGDYVATAGGTTSSAASCRCILIAVMVVARRSSSGFSDTQLPDPPVPWGQVHLGAGVVAAVLVVLRLLIGSDDVGGVDIGFDLDRKFGLFLAVIAAIVVAVGGVKKASEGDARRRPAGHRLRPVLIPR